MRYPAASWPIADLAVSEAFVIPMQNDRDLGGRPSQQIRVMASTAGKRLGRTFSVTKLKSGDLAVTRIA